MWAAGQKIGDYELVATLRSGGMATLYLAKRGGPSGFARPVAIKVVHPELAADAQFRTMFLDEALLASRIQHPNVVQVEALGEHEGFHYLVMEFVHGCSLSQLTRALAARGRRLAPAFATRIAMYVADALHAAHETRGEGGKLLGVVHRDVSPENILLAYAGHVKLIDFGIAKAEGQRHQTQEGLLKGKFRYMAPEQAYGKPVDRRTDIYQLGIVLWEMLTQRALFEGETEHELLGKVRDPEISPPSAWVKGIPPALDQVVMTALAQKPARRHPSAQIMARALAKALPTAHDVDSGALSELLLSAMREHRSRQQATFPPGVYERLEQQIETLRMGGADPNTEAKAALSRATVEQTAPYGSDSSGGRVANRAAMAQQAESHARHRPEPPARRAPAPRARRLVRLASELRTTLTAIERGLRGRRGPWLLAGAAVGLAFVLASLTYLLREKPKARVAPPPPATVDAASQRIEPEAPARHASAVERAAPGPASADTQGLSPEDAGARGARPEASHPRELPRLRTVDGTPLFTEPGF